MADDYDATQAAAALRSLRGTAVTMRTRPSLSGLRGYSYAIETAAGTLAAQLERLTAELDTVRAAARATVTAGTGGAVRADHPDTAKAAAKLDQLRERPKRGAQRDRIMLEVAAVDRGDDGSLDSSLAGCTDAELQAALGLSGNSERPRRVELVDGGWLHDGGGRRRVDGDDHIVWTLTGKGRQVYRP